jgi:hypothetical protein
MGRQPFGLPAVAKPAPKVELHSGSGIFGKSLEALRLVAPGSAAGQQSNLSIARRRCATPQAFNRFVITTKGCFQDGVGIHQAWSDQLLRRLCRGESQGHAFLAGVVAQGGQNPRFHQHSTLLNRLSDAA